ncbi:MAG: SpvB/TcaC N-terminal domain-containing protein, partial [Lysobacterales bacterium]
MTPDAASSRVGVTAGEFRVDESGNATYRVPILTAPGSGGMAPRISLNYSSKAGNGPMGMGWSLGGISAITRCSRTIEQDGKSGRRGVTLTANDRFCMDGQRLIAVSGTYGATGAEYRSEVDTISKIVSSGMAGTGPQSFTVWRKDGSVIQYGATADSRIEARTASDSQTVFTWAQNRVTDAAGNYIDYVYTEFTSAGGEPVEFLLASVLYTGNAGAATVPYAQIDFIYDSNRTDSTVGATGGAQFAQSRLLKRIDSRSRVSAGSSLTSLRSYHLTYQAGGDGYGRAALSAITECNDSNKTYCFPPTALDWQRSKHQVSNSSVTIGSVFNSKHAGLAMADINGDGRPDLLLSEKSGNAFVFRT